MTEPAAIDPKAHRPARLARTPARRAFLASFAEDICALDAGLKHADRASFVAAVVGMDFDGQSDAGEVRVARNLLAAGLLKTLEVHGCAGGQPGIYVVFSEVGASAVFDELPSLSES